ncbi:MAG TPA: hypothetical protein VM510_08190, partial [Caulifigura sp.]|nr:hypothetical protein [Caulifigura sp.]
IWGGEVLLCTLKAFRRVGRLRPFALPGGERAIREPWRVAISLLTHVLAPAELEEACRRLFHESLVQQTALIQRSMRSAPVTTSAGRLFDGIAALVLQVHESSFEGQPALQLEDCCDPVESGRYDFFIESGPLHELDWRPAIGSIVDDLKAGVTGGRIAMKFHRGLASGVAKICDQYPDHPVVLGGGVFQNRTLVEELSDRLPSSRLGLPGRIPPNDGGLAAGQLAIAAEILSTLSPH